MQKPNNWVSQPLESVRCQILNSYLTTIEESFKTNRSQLKLINYGTGSGKTHQLFQAICETIKKYQDIQIVGIYIAPLTAHLSVPDSVKSQYQNIPVYQLNSLDMKMTDEYIKFYKKCIPLILKNRSLWEKALKKSSQEKVEEYQQKLKTVLAVMNRLEYIKQVGFGDKKLNDSETLKARREFNKLFESFLEFIIKHDLHQDYCKKECSKLIEIFFPLYLLREKSGILMLTYDKFETKIPYFKPNSETWVKKSEYLDQYVIQCTSSSKKFIFAFDEQEDGYQIILDKKIDIISPEALAINNALSSIIREFSILFSKRSKENRQLLKFLDRNKGAFHELQEHIEKDKNIQPQLQEYAHEYQRLTSEEGNSIEFLQEVISISKGLEKSLEEIVAIFNEYDEENPIELSFEMLASVLAKFENTKSLLIPQKLYAKISDDLMNIFSYNNLYIYNIESLKNLFLTKKSGGHVYIDEGKGSSSTSVAELIYAILAMRSQIKNIKEILANVLDAKNAEDSQSRSLDIWSQQISKVQTASENEKNITEHKKTKYLDRNYVYESNKSIINIKEIYRYQKLIDPQLREVSIGSTAIFTSPEHKISSILANSTNIIFLISATGGIIGDLTTSYDLCYLEDKLRDESGKSALKPMNQSEVELCEKIRNYRQENREITVNFFNPDSCSFPNDKTQAVVERFKDTILQNFITQIKQQMTVFSRYKEQELIKFIQYLSQPEANHFRQQQHQILLGKGILQAIGRTERRDFSGQVIKIFINEETRQNLMKLYNYLKRKEADEIRKLSVNNYAVYLNVVEEEKKRAIPNYEEHIYDEIDAELAFQEFREIMLNEIELFHQKKHTFNIKKVLAVAVEFLYKEGYIYIKNIIRDLKQIKNDFKFLRTKNNSED